MLRSAIPLAFALAACSGGSTDLGATTPTGAGGTSPGQGGGASAGASGAAASGGIGGAPGAGGDAGAAGAGAPGAGAAGASPAAGASGTGGAAGASGGGGAAAGASGGGGFVPCMGTASSTLPGVTLAFPPDVKCIYTTTEVSGGIKIPYRLHVDAPSAGLAVSNTPQASCEVPGQSGLFVLERLEGMGQSYCICDAGLCAPPPTATLAAGEYPMAFSWSGKNWNGPSDTGAPKGSPFPAGKYELTVKALGTTSSAGTPFAVTATLQIQLLGMCGPCAPAGAADSIAP
jgi:hypothetical protein